MKSFPLFIALLFSIFASAQNDSIPKVVTDVTRDTIYKTYYPEGVYETKENFVNKRSKNYPLSAKSIFRRESKKVVYQNGTPMSCLFYYTKTNERIQGAFAVCYKGELYFQMGGIFGNINSKDRFQENMHSDDQFVKVIIGGSHYFYTEAELGDALAQGVALQTSGAAGYQATLSRKGVVWDIYKREFNVFKNCKDYNRFLSTAFPEGVQDCEKRAVDLWEIRKMMQTIK